MHEDQISRAVAQRFKDLDDKLVSISGQIGEMKREMVTRKEYNDAHEPLIRMVKEHEIMVKAHDKVYLWGIRNRNRLAWWGFVSVITSIWAAPHVNTIGRWITETFK